MTSFNARAGDNNHWMRHILRTDLRYQTEHGNAFTSSGIWEIVGNTTDYLEFRVQIGKVVRVYDRITSQDANSFTVDLCRIDSITPGMTELPTTNMRVGTGMPSSSFWRGGSDPVNLVVLEENLLPASSAGNSSGGLADRDAYRVFEGSATPYILRITNSETQAKNFNIIILFTEQDE